MPQVKKRAESYLPMVHWWHGWVLVDPGHVWSVRVSFSHQDRKLGLLLSFRERHGNPRLCQVVTRSLVNLPGPTPGLRFLLPHKEWPHTAWIKCSSDCWAVHNKPAQAVSLAPVIISQACKREAYLCFNPFSRSKTSPISDANSINSCVYYIIPRDTCFPR